MKTAIVYDRVNKWGGAERVLLVLHEMFPEAPLYTSVYNPETAPWAKVFTKIIPSFLQRGPLVQNHHEWLAPIMPMAFESFNFDEYDLVISVTSEAAKGIVTKPGTKHLCYCLTPTRYLWSGYDDYFKGLLLKGIAYPVVEYLKEWDKIAAQRPDVMVAISRTVRDRIKKYYNRKVEVVYPPLGLPSTVYRLLQKKAAVGSLLTESYYLVVSRLVPYKRVDLAIEAFNKLGYPLVVVGTGSEDGRLKSMSLPAQAGKKNIKFVGQVSDDELADYYAECRALIMPQEEDFGLVSAEAQSFGKPVIAYQKGGALDTVIEGETGLFFSEQNVASLTYAIQKLHNDYIGRIDPAVCIENAKRFSKERFKKEFLEIIAKLEK